MRFVPMLLAATAAGLTSAGAADAASVEVKDAVARVTVIPENRTDVKVEVVAANARLPLKVRSLGGRTLVDGDLDRRIRECRGSGERALLPVRSAGEVAGRDMPPVVIRPPRAGALATRGGGWGG